MSYPKENPKVEYYLRVVKDRVAEEWVSGRMDPQTPGLVEKSPAPGFVFSFEQAFPFAACLVP